jgi:large subunit ribosomal protein L15
MDLSNLKPAKGSKRSKKRLGRGEGSGTGDTAGRGHKGQKSRSGYSRKLGFEGGQMPLQRRVPKFGFKNINRKSYKAINISSIQEIAEGRDLTDIDVNVLRDAGLIGKGDLVKILGNGTLEKKVNVKAHAFSAKAKEAIEAVQGTTEVIS